MKALAHGTPVVALQRMAPVSTKEPGFHEGAMCPVPFMKYPG
jgi:hypothetical protein